MQGEPYRRGLARKLVSDPVGFDLQAFLQIIGRSSQAITIKEVLAHLPADLPSADDALLTYEHWVRNVALLRRQLVDAEQKENRAHAEYRKAVSRERAIKEAEKLT